MFVFLSLGARLNGLQLSRAEMLMNIDGAEKGATYWQDKVGRLFLTYVQLLIVFTGALL